MISCIVSFIIVLLTIHYTVITCGSPVKENRKRRQKTPLPTAPDGIPLGGSGEKDDDTLKSVPSLQKDRQIVSPPFS